MSQNASIDNEVLIGLAKAIYSALFGRLYDKVWNRKLIRLQTKLKAIVVPTLQQSMGHLPQVYEQADPLSHCEPQETPRHQTAG